MSELQEIKIPPNTIISKGFVSSNSSEEDTKCEWMNEKGERMGERCGRPTFKRAKYCAAHTTVDLKRKKLARREKVEIVEVELPLDDIEEDEDEEYEDFPSHISKPLIEIPNSNSITDEEIVSILKVVVTILAHIRLK